MRIVILGSGGREHALSYRLAMEHNVSQINVIPGNPGMMYSSDKIKSISIPIIKPEFHDLCSKMKELQIDLVIVGPEQPLADGVSNALEKNGISVLGPSKDAARLESSKVFAKKFMKTVSIPTAKYEEFNNCEKALDALQLWDVENKGIVIKASSLAGGKGVVVTHSRSLAQKTIFDFLENPECTVNTKELILEEMLHGKEVSAFGLLDGNNFIMLGYACDHKRLLDDDKGPNTGGMGCYSSHEWPSIDQRTFIEEQIIQQTLIGMKEQGMPYKGFLFVGLMIDESKKNNNGIKVIEYNVRFGDPEAQTLLPLVLGRMSDAFLAAAKGELKESHTPLALSSKSSIHIVMTSGGYPSIDGTPMSLGHQITYSKNLLPTRPLQEKQLFFAGVKSTETGLINTGGRVLGMTVLADTLDNAKENAYLEIEKISFKDAFYRKDIGRGIHDYD